MSQFPNSSIYSGLAQCIYSEFSNFTNFLHRALAAGLLTIPLSIALNLAFPQMPFFNRTGVVFWTCVVVSVIVSLVTKPKPEEELKGLMWNKSVLRVPENERKFNRGFRNTGMWWAIITVLVLYFYIRYA